MNYLDNEKGVSPVIGVILMVAITVTLAAVVAAFVMGHASGVEKPKTVETKVRQLDDTSGEFIFIGGPDASAVKYFNLSGKNSLDNQIPDFKDPILNPPVGSVMAISDLTTGSDHVIITATYKDSTKQVVLDTNI